MVFLLVSVIIAWVIALLASVLLRDYTLLRGALLETCAAFECLMVEVAFTVASTAI